MKIKGIDHVGIAVDNFEKSSRFWRHVLQLQLGKTETVEGESVRTDIYETGKGKIELLHALGDDSPVTKFIEKSGAGIHHICFEVEDIFAAIQELIDAGIDVIYKEPRKGVEGYLITFIHPKSTGGVLVELAQKPV